MMRKKLLKIISEKILSIKKDSPVLVGINGVDASGKTILTKELSQKLKKSERKIMIASVDDFLNPKDIRYQKDKNPAESFYYDSYNYDAIINLLLKPFHSGNLEYRNKFFDYRINSEIDCPTQEAEKNSILIMEGIFLFRPELIDFWDLKIFLDVDFETTLQRALERETEKNHIGSKQKIIDRYKKRYIPGQKLYLKEVNPKAKSDIVIDNSDWENPKIRRKMSSFMKC